MNEFEQKQQPTTPGIKGIEGAMPKNADMPDYFVPELPEDEELETQPYTPITETNKPKNTPPKQESPNWVEQSEERNANASAKAAKTN